MIIALRCFSFTSANERGFINTNIQLRKQAVKSKRAFAVRRFIHAGPSQYQLVHMELAIETIILEILSKFQFSVYSYTLSLRNAFNISICVLNVSGKLISIHIVQYLEIYTYNTSSSWTGYYKALLVSLTTVVKEAKRLARIFSQGCNTKFDI